MIRQGVKLLQRAAIAAVLAACALPALAQTRPAVPPGFVAPLAVMRACADPVHFSTDILSDWEESGFTPAFEKEWTAAALYLRMSTDDSYLLPNLWKLSPAYRAARAELTEHVSWELEEIAQNLETLRATGTLHSDQNFKVFTHASGWRLLVQTREAAVKDRLVDCRLWHPAPDQAQVEYLVVGPFGTHLIPSTFGKKLQHEVRFELDRGWHVINFVVFTDQNWPRLQPMPLMISVVSEAWYEGTSVALEWTDAAEQHSDLTAALVTAAQVCATPTIMPGDWPAPLKGWTVLPPSDALLTEFAAARTMLFDAAQASYRIPPESPFMQWEIERHLRPKYTSSLRYRRDALDKGALTFLAHPTGWTLTLKVDPDPSNAAHNSCVFWHPDPDAATRDVLSTAYLGLRAPRHMFGTEIDSEYTFSDEGDYGPVNYHAMTDVPPSALFETAPVYLDVVMSAFKREERLEAMQ